MVLRKGDLVPPSLRRYATAVTLSQNAATVLPKRDDWKWRRLRRTASSSLALIGRQDSNLSQWPEATREPRCAPHPTSEALDQNYRSGDTCQRHSLRQTRQVEPQLQIPKAVRGPCHRSRLVHPIPRPMKAKLKRPHAKSPPWDEVSHGEKHPQQRKPNIGGRRVGGQKFSGGSQEPGDAIRRRRSQKRLGI